MICLCETWRRLAVCSFTLSAVLSACKMAGKCVTVKWSVWLTCRNEVRGFHVFLPCKLLPYYDCLRALCNKYCMAGEDCWHLTADCTKPLVFHKRWNGGSCCIDVPNSWGKYLPVLQLDAPLRSTSSQWPCLSVVWCWADSKQSSFAETSCLLPLKTTLLRVLKPCMLEN